MVSGVGDGEGDKRGEVPGVLRPHAEGPEDGVRRGDQGGAVSGDAGEAETEMCYFLRRRRRPARARNITFLYLFL